MQALSIKKDILIAAPPEAVFHALTSPEEIVKFFPVKQVISDWQIGSEILYKGEINGEPFTDYGLIEELSPPNKFKYTYWSDNHGTERTAENHLSICYTLSESGSGTKLVLEHSNFKSEDMFHMMDTVVWDALVSNLKNYIESRS